MSYRIRPYTSSDETSWLRCRALSFLATAYFDDVRRTKPRISPPGLDLVAVTAAGHTIGIIDVEVTDDLATIDTIAVHPDYQRRGIGQALVAEARSHTRELGVATLDAWTRDDPGTLGWYRAMGFTETDHYLHVYANYDTHPEEPDRAIGARRPGLRPVSAFLHAQLSEEDTLRGEFKRVHVCRRFAMTP